MWQVCFTPGSFKPMKKDVPDRYCLVGCVEKLSAQPSSSQDSSHDSSSQEASGAPQGPRRAPPEPPQPHEIHPEQWLMALELAERIRRAYGAPSWAELRKQFDKVDFCIFTANLKTVASQTSKRVREAQLCSAAHEEDGRGSWQRVRLQVANAVLAGPLATKWLRHPEAFGWL